MIAIDDEQLDEREAVAAARCRARCQLWTTRSTSSTVVSPASHLRPSVRAQRDADRARSASARSSARGARARDRVAHFVRHDEQLEDADAPAKSGAAALRAARAARQRRCDAPGAGEHARRLRAGGSYASRQASQMRRTSRCARTPSSVAATQIIRDAEIERAAASALMASLVWSVREDEMSRHRRLHRDLRRLLIAHLADHDDVGILPQDRAQRRAERDAGLAVHRHLRDAGQLILDRILDRDDLLRAPRRGAGARRRASSSCRCRSVR